MPADVSHIKLHTQQPATVEVQWNHILSFALRLRRNQRTSQADHWVKSFRASELQRTGMEERRRAFSRQSRRVGSAPPLFRSGLSLQMRPKLFPGNIALPLQPPSGTEGLHSARSSTSKHFPIRPPSALILCRPGLKVLGFNHLAAFTEGVENGGGGNLGENKGQSHRRVKVEEQAVLLTSLRVQVAFRRANQCRDSFLP